MMMTPLNAAEVRLLVDAQLPEMGDFVRSARLHAVDSKEETPLHIAARCGKLALCDLLVQHGADPSVRNAAGETAAEVAAAEGYVVLSQLLKSLEVDGGGAAGDLPIILPIIPFPKPAVVDTHHDLSFEAEADPETYRAEQVTGFSDKHQATFSPFVAASFDGVPDWNLDTSSGSIEGDGIGDFVVEVPTVRVEDEFLVIQRRGRKSIKHATLSVGTRMHIDTNYVQTWVGELLECHRVPHSDVEALILSCSGNADEDDLWNAVASILDFVGVQQLDNDDPALWDAPIAVDSDDISEALEAGLTRNSLLPGRGRFRMDRADQELLLGPMLQAKAQLHLALISSLEAVRVILRFADMVLAGRLKPEYLTLLAVFPGRENDAGSLVLQEVADTLRAVSAEDTAIEGKRRRLALLGIENLDLSPIFFKALGKYLSEHPGHLEAANAIRKLIAELDAITARLIDSHLPYARRFASRHAEEGEDLEDVFQMAFIGLQKATRRFDPERGTPFSMYASTWMRQTVTRWRADERAMIRIPVHRHADLAALDEAHERLAVHLGRTPTGIELAADREWSEQHVEKLLDTPRTQVEWDDLEQDWLTFPAEQNFRIEELQTAEVLAEALAELDQRQADVLRKRFGFEEGGEMTLEEVGQIYGVTRERIRQIEAKALLKLSNAAVVRRLRSLVGN